MARQFPLNRQEAELLVDLLQANIDDGDAYLYDGNCVGEELLAALKKEFGMVKDQPDLAGPPFWPGYRHE